jgi:PIN domain nuclease of toxin-antitoxin system
MRQHRLSAAKLSAASRESVDTHVVVWLFAGDAGRLSKLAKQAIEQYDLRVSPMVKLELGYLYEIGRITVPPESILRDLAVRIGLLVHAESYERIVDHALALRWTRDVFDRLLVAHAEVEGTPLISKDASIRKHYPRTIW